LLLPNRVAGFSGMVGLGFLFFGGIFMMLDTSATAIAHTTVGPAASSPASSEPSSPAYR
jgi:hypothetical protein